MTKQFPLTTERALIRGWRLSDRAAFRGMATDVELMRFVTAGVPMSAEMQAAFFQRQADQLQRFGVCMGALVWRETGQVVGVAGLQCLDMEQGLDIGWWVQKSHQGLGLATEAAVALQAVARATHPQLPLSASIDAGNRASQRVAARLGLVATETRAANSLASWRPEEPVTVYREPSPGSC